MGAVPSRRQLARRCAAAWGWHRNRLGRVRFFTLACRSISAGAHRLHGLYAPCFRARRTRVRGTHDQCSPERSADRILSCPRCGCVSPRKLFCDRVFASASSREREPKRSRTSIVAADRSRFIRSSDNDAQLYSIGRSRRRFACAYARRRCH